MYGNTESTTIVGPSGINRNYRPTPFQADVDRYEGVPGKECEFIPSGYEHPDYSVLDQRRIESYLWWRQCADSGELIDVDPGYAWLRVTELINSKGDPGEVLSKIIGLVTACSKSGRLKHIGPKIAVDFAVLNSLSLDLIPWREPFIGNESVAAWNAVGYPARFRPELLLTRVAERMVRNSDIEREEMRDIVSLSIDGIDTICRCKGISILRSLGYSIDYMQRLPFEGYLTFERKGLIFVPVLDLFEGRFPELIDAIASTAARLSGCKTAVPRWFDQDYRGAVAAAYDSIRGSEGWDVNWFKSGDEFFQGRDIDATADSFPRVIEQTGVDNTVPDIRKDDALHHWNESRPVSPYIPSGMRKASLDRLDEIRREYYLGWREEARQGRFLSTDEGYIWLYCVESVLVDDDPRGIQDNLEAMHESFEAKSYAPLVLTTAAFDHAVLHGFDPPPFTGRMLEWQMLTKLESRPIGRMSLILGQAYSFYDPTKYILADEGLYEEAFTLAMRAADSMLFKSDGMRLEDLARTIRSRDEETLYRGMLVHGKESKKVSRLFVREQSKLSEIIDSVFRATIHTVNSRLGLQVPKIPKGFEAMVNQTFDVVGRFMDEHLDRVRREWIEREISHMTLDLTAVHSAEQDLDVVRDLMSVEGDEVEEIKVEEEAPTGWIAFLQALSDVERNYLSFVLFHDGPDPLAGTGLRAIIVESSINEKAMECIGDAVMEDGEVFEDYVEEIREGL